MNIALTNSVLWPAIAAVVIPLLIHLFAKARPPRYRFSSVEFILRVVRTNLRLKRPRSLLLLAVRTLLFAALIGLFLRPLFFAAGDLAARFQNKDVVIIVDATASMGYVEGSQTRFAKACAEASEILRGLGAGDRANVVWLRSQPEAIFPKLGDNHTYLRAALRRARPTLEAGNIEGALTLAADMLGSSDRRREICIVSDYQRTAWQDRDLSVPDGIDVIHVNVTRADGNNTAVTAFYSAPAQPLAGEPVKFYCEVRNFSPQAKAVTAYFSVAEVRQHRELMLGPWGRNTVVFVCELPREGRCIGNVTLGEDEFPADNARWCHVHVRNALHVALAAGDSSDAGTWRRALEALGWAKVATVAAERIDESLDCDALIVLGNSGATGISALLGKRATGAPHVIWQPVAGMPVADLVNTLRAAASEPENREQVLADVRPNAPVQPRIVSSEHPVFAAFAKGDFGDPTRAAFSRYLGLPLKRLPKRDDLLMFEDGTPALTLLADSNLTLWNLPLVEDIGDFARQPEFVVLLGELLLHGRSRRGESAAFGPHHTPGEALTWTVPQGQLTEEVRLAAPSGETLAVDARRTSRGLRMVSAGVAAEAGVYRWSHDGNALAESIVNVSPVESDLRGVPREQLAESADAVVAGGVAVRRLREGTELWPALLGAAVLLLFIESGLLLQSKPT